MEPSPTPSGHRPLAKPGVGRRQTVRMRTCIAFLPPGSHCFPCSVKVRSARHVARELIPKISSLGTVSKDLLVKVVKVGPPLYIKLGSLGNPSHPPEQGMGTNHDMLALHHIQLILWQRWTHRWHYIFGHQQWYKWSRVMWHTRGKYLPILGMG